MPNNADYCADLVRQADRDRYLATLFAPAEHRDALFALYAFNVEISRVRDLAREPMPGEIRLQWWREVLSGERRGEGEANPVSAALLGALQKYGFVAGPLLELIDAHTFDLYGEPMGTVDALELYAIRTQAPVFAMAAGILNRGGALPENFSLDASVAMAICKMLIDLPKHASRRQLFLPLDSIELHGVDIEDIFAGQATDAVRAALVEMRVLARGHLAKASQTMRSVPLQILPALLPLALVGPALRLMDRKDYEPFRFMPLLQWKRQWLLWRAARNPKRIFSI